MVKENRKNFKKDKRVGKAGQGNVMEKGVPGSYLIPVLLGVVVVLTFLIYLPALKNQFTNWDDGVYVTGNQYIKALSSENVKHIFTGTIAANYHPLTILSLAVNYKISGMSPFSYFLVNIILHLLNILLVYRFVELLPGRNRIMALFTAALFAVHPMHVESVAWISERKDLLYTFFFLASLIAYIQYRDRKSYGLLAVSFLLYLLSGLSKPTAVVLPLVLWMIDYLRKRKVSTGMVLEKIPFLLISIWIGIMTIRSQTEMVTGDMSNFSLFQKLIFASFGFCAYIVKLILPAGLSAFYPFPVQDQAGALPLIYWLAPAGVIAVATLAVWSLRQTRVVMFGILFYLAGVALTLQIVQVGHAVIADRYTYLSYVGLLIALFWLADRYIPDRSISKLKLSWIFFILFFAVNTVLAAVRIPVWHNSETLWTDEITKHPETAIAYNNRGLFYFDLKKYDSAIADYSSAVQHDPEYFEAWYNRGGTYLKVSRFKEAVADFKTAGALNPNYSVSFRLLADAYSGLGFTDSAVMAYTRAIAINPQAAESYNNRGNLYMAAGQLEKAAGDFREALNRNPKEQQYWFNLGTAYGRMNKFTEAVEYLTKALEIKPDLYVALTNRAMSYANLGKQDEVLRDLAEAIRIEPENQSAYYNRAIFYLNNRKKDLACRDLEMAIRYGNQEARGIWQRECRGGR